MNSVTLGSGASFEVHADLTILEAAARASVFLPYSCKLGRCSTCKCKVIDGLTRSLQPELGLTDQEKAAGWILSCVRTADTDVTLEAEELGDIDLPVARTLPCRIHDINPLAPDVIRVLLRLPPTVEFKFLPGQHINLIGPNNLRRSYSLANANFDAGLLELHIRAVEGGALSQYWFSKARPNDLLRFTGPLGTFFLRECAGVDLIFLVTGTGFAPAKAILESMAQIPPAQRPKTLTVVWGGRESQDLYANLADLSCPHTYIPVLSRPTDDWTGSRGYVQDAFMATKPELSNAVVYACGSEAMIESAKTLLVNSGLAANRFYSDAFVSSGTN